MDNFKNKWKCLHLFIFIMSCNTDTGTSQYPWQSRKIEWGAKTELLLVMSIHFLLLVHRQQVLLV